MSETMPVGGYHVANFNFGPVMVNAYSKTQPNKKQNMATFMYRKFAETGMTPVPGIYHDENDGMVMIVSLIRKK